MDSLIGDVPDDWHQRRLDECCDVQPGPGGSAITSADRVIDGVPVVSARDIHDGRISPTPAVSVHPETARRYHRYQLTVGDILVVRVGSRFRHARADPTKEGWLMGSSCIRLRPRPETGLTSAYLDCYLTHPSVRDWLAQQSRSGIIPTAATGRIAALPVVLPPLDVQYAIVDVVRTLDDKIEVHEKIRRTTQTLRDLLIPQLLSGTVTS
jgi:restriction endonuclease S subunit